MSCASGKRPPVVEVNTVTAVAYAEFENVIEVDRDRNVVFDFGV